MIKKRENCGLFPKKGGGSKKTKKSEIQIRTFENPWEGVSIFQKCLNYKLLSDPILKINIKALNLTLFHVNMPK